MSYTRIAIALGMPERSTEDAIVQRIEAQRMAAARDRAVVAELCELTGKTTGTEALGVAHAHALTAAGVGGGGPKTYDQLTFMERHQLKKQNPELHRSMKNAAASASESYPVGKRYDEMTHMERHQLKKQNPALHRKLKDEALAAGAI